MADKKITALTELSATGKAGEDFLHIIDYGGGSSPVNKKISLTNLFNNANLDTHIYGASKTLEVGFAAAQNAHLTVTTGSGASADGTVTINDDGVDFVDLLVKSKTSDQAIKVDSGTDKVIINGDAVDCDFTVSGENVAALLHVDAGLDAVGIVKAAPDTAYSLTVGATGTNGIKSEGSINVTGDITASGNLTVTGFMIWNDAIATAIAGGANVGAKVEIPITDLVTHLDPGSSTGHYGLANGAAGQIKILFNSDAAETATITPTTFASGTTLTLQTKESSMLMYTTGGWIVLNHPGSAIT